MNCALMRNSSEVWWIGWLVIETYFLTNIKELLISHLDPFLTPTPVHTDTHTQIDTHTQTHTVTLIIANVNHFYEHLCKDRWNSEHPVTTSENYVWEREGGICMQTEEIRERKVRVIYCVLTAPLFSCTQIWWPVTSDLSLAPVKKCQRRIF